MNQRDYPTEEELEKIKKWDGDLHDLMEFIRGIWWMADWGFSKSEEAYNLSTGGWSGNEDIIAAMRDNFLFWSQCWETSRRGGHYTFNLKGAIS